MKYLSIFFISFLGVFADDSIVERDLEKDFLVHYMEAFDVLSQDSIDLSKSNYRDRQYMLNMLKSKLTSTLLTEFRL